MAVADLVTIPTITGSVDQRFLVEPLGGPKDTFYYLDRFPEEIYHKSPDTHLYKFLRTVLGEAGVNWIKKNHLEARIMLEEQGIDLFDLDNFYGNPFAFGRIVEEAFDEDPYGLIPKAQWEQIKAKNARYRNRALDFISGVRAGNTPQGMRLVAKSGLGHDVEIVENYRYLYDIHSDDPLGLPYLGRTTSTEEMVIVPRREVGVSEQQLISIIGDPLPPDSGTYTLIYNGQNTGNYTYSYDEGFGPQDFNSLPFNATRDQVRLALESLPDVEPGDVYVQGGPGPVEPFIVKFQGRLSNRDVPEIQIVSNLTRSDDPNNTITTQVYTIVGGEESIDETVNIPSRSKYHLQQAVDRTRPQTTIMTLAEGRGMRQRNNWTSVFATSEYTEVLRYVTGTSNIRWPQATSDNPTYWIESQVEKEAPQVRNNLQHHYTGFHNIGSIQSSSDFATPDAVLTADRATADYAEPLMVTASTELRSGKAASFINGIYPTDYRDLPGSPAIRYTEEQYWSSAEREGEEILTVNLAFVKAVNYICFDISKCPVRIDIEYDAYDNDDQLWVPVTPVIPYGNVIASTLNEQNPWASVGLRFSNRKSEMVFTRSLKLRFIRQQMYNGAIRVKNLRVARNVA